MITHCQICGEFMPCERHHVFGGTSRQISDKYGAVVWLCRKCHRAYHDHPAAYQWIKEKTQARVMFEQGWTTEDWIKHFYKNYLGDER